MHNRTQSRGIPPLERKVPKSEKYAHVRSVLDTGLTVDKVKSVTAREYAKRRDEIFFRITRAQLFELYNEYEADEYESITESTHGAGGRIVTYSESDQPVYNKPYLILDIRESYEFNSCHLMQARSFPYALLRRDQFHPEIYRYKNKTECLIIVYCDDERMSRDAAKDLVDRGIDNIFLLTGGMKEFAYEYPDYVEGNVPVSPSKPTKPQSRLTRIAEDKAYSTSDDLQSRSSRAPPSPQNKLTMSKLERHNNAVGGASSTSRRTSRGDGRSDAGTTMSNMSVAESVISRAAARKGKF